MDNKPKVASPLVASFLTRVEKRLGECEYLNDIDSRDIQKFIDESVPYKSEFDQQLLDDCKKMLNEILNSRQIRPKI